MPAEDSHQGRDDAAGVAPVARCYQMRLLSRHVGSDNEMMELDFALRRLEEDWQPFTPTVHSSPFLNFLHSAFLCQLAYLRLNATERSLRVNRVHGLCHCETSDFTLTRFLTSFALGLDGVASDDDLAYLRERCLACPVSRNLPHVADKDTVVTLGSQATLPDGSPK